MPLRDYQQKTLDDLLDWFDNNKSGNPCIVLPTGSGKSWVIAELCKYALQQWPQTKILNLTHVKEIIQQDVEKMDLAWPFAPVGIYCAGLGQKNIEPITFASIHSIRTRAEQLGHIDLILIDECHRVSHKNEGGYRKFIEQLRAINPSLRVVGFTATPYRLGHGLITDDPALFKVLIEPVSIQELIHKGWLAPLRSKATKKKLDTSGVKKVGGEFVESELQKAVNTEDNNINVINEVIEKAENKKSWLFFCTGVDHAVRICEILNSKGIVSKCVTGKTPKEERAQILEDFKSGKIKAVTNANVLTTGFDHPSLDLIAMLRPTLSASLYVQMAGRGMRTAEGKADCLVLDFAGVVSTHGPITAVQPTGKNNGTGEAPFKVCPVCEEILHASVKKCKCCGHKFPKKKKDLKLREDDIMGMNYDKTKDVKIISWTWRKQTSFRSGKEMLTVSYYKSLSSRPIIEYFTIYHGGYASQRAIKSLTDIAQYSGAVFKQTATLQDTADSMNNSKCPSSIRYRRDGNFYRILGRQWNPPLNKEGDKAIPK